MPRKLVMKLVMKERDRVRREMDYLQETLRTLQDDISEFEMGKSVLCDFCEQLDDNIQQLAARLKVLRTSDAVQREHILVHEMNMSIPKPSL